MSQERSLNIGVVCGEHSGDRLGTDLIKEIKKHVDINLYGVGGPRLEELGVRSEFDFSEINIMGLVEPLANFRRLNNLRNSLIKLFINNKIDYFIGIDSPDFNMGIHKALKKNHDNKNNDKSINNSYSEINKIFNNNNKNQDHKSQYL